MRVKIKLGFTIRSTSFEVTGILIIRQLIIY